VIGEIISDLIAGMVAESLFGKWARRHPRLTAAICVPPLLLIAVLAVRQFLVS
jgi:hypothetical protein